MSSTFNAVGWLKHRRHVMRFLHAHAWPQITTDVVALLDERNLLADTHGYSGYLQITHNIIFASSQITTDVVALLDEWAARFFEELDYVHEGRNAEKFAAQMKDDLPQVGGACMGGVAVCEHLSSCTAVQHRCCCAMVLHGTVVLRSQVC